MRGVYLVGDEEFIFESVGRPRIEYLRGAPKLVMRLRVWAGDTNDPGDLVVFYEPFVGWSIQEGNADVSSSALNLFCREVLRRYAVRGQEIQGMARLRAQRIPSWKRC